MAFTDEDKKLIREEIAEARRILREDRVLAKLNKHFPDQAEEEDDGLPKPPPKKDKPEEPPKKRDAWWGDALDDGE